MIPPERHAVVHWTNVDHRVARYAATTVRTFLAAAKRRTLKYSAPASGQQSGSVIFASGDHQMQCSTKSRNLTCTMNSWNPEDTYEITVTMPLTWSIEGEPIGDDPEPSLDHLRLFVALASVPGCVLGIDEFGLPGFRDCDERGLEIERGIEDTTADMMALWATVDTNEPRSIKVETPLLDRPGRIDRTPLVGGSEDGGTNGFVPDRKMTTTRDHVLSTLPPAAVLYKDGPTHFCIRAYSVTTNASVPDPMETMRRMAAVSTRMESPR